MKKVLYIFLISIIKIVHANSIVESNFGINCSGTNVIGIEKENTIYTYSESGGIALRKATNLVRTSNKYEFTITSTTGRSARISIDRKTLVSTQNGVIGPYVQQCVVLDAEEYKNITNKIIDTISEQNQRKNDAEKNKNKQIDDYNRTPNKF